MVQIQFEDGTCEERPATSPCVLSLDVPPRAPDDPRPGTLVDVEPPILGYGDPVVMLFCGRPVVSLQSRRGVDVWVWRTTGGCGAGEVSTGAWWVGRVESFEEQIQRLEAERTGVVAAFEQRIADWRAEHADRVRERDDAERRAENHRRMADAYLGLLSGKDRVTAEEDGTYTQTWVAVDLLAHFVFSMLRASQAKNLVSTVITGKDGERAMVIVQRPDGKTSEELRLAEKARADAAEKSLEELARVVGAALCAATLEEGESMSDPPEHAIVSTVVDLRRRLVTAEAKLTDLRAWAEREVTVRLATLPSSAYPFEQVVEMLDGKAPNAAEVNLARVGSYLFGPDLDHCFRLARVPDHDLGGDTWQILQLHTTSFAWDGEAWEYGGRKIWSLADGWAECERIVREGIYPAGNRFWFEGDDSDDAS